MFGGTFPGPNAIPARALAVPTALHALFFLSGASGLAFQIAWTRMFSTGLGHEMPAVLAVLGAIFGGMAAGAWAAEHSLRANRRPGRWYGCLELIIGVWGLALIPLIPWINRTAPAITGLDPNPFFHWSIALILPGIALLPATAAIGATFPAMERFLAPLSPGGRCVGGLYAASTFGAVTGVLVSTAAALPMLGFTNTLALFSVVSLFCGVAALILDSSLKLDCPKRELAVGRLEPDVQSPSSPRWRQALVLWSAGLLGIGYEVLGVRVLAQVLENTVYTFAVVLAVFLLGTATGGALYQVSSRRWRANHLFALLSIGTLSGVWILAGTPTAYQALRSYFGDAAVALFIAEFLTALMVFAMPTTLMGATFSHLVQSARAHGFGVGHAVGVNTLGSALAPLVFGVLIFPLWGAKWSFVLLSAGYLSLAWPWNGWVRWLAGATIVLSLALPARLPWITPAPGERIVAHREGVSDTVAVVERSDGNRSLVVNNRFMMGGTGAAMAERRHASIPLLLHPQPRRALFLGLGTGITFAAASAHKGLAAEGVELVPEIVDLLPWFHPYNSTPDSDRFKIHVADARRFVRVTPHEYDVIVADLFHPARDGAGPLYSLEHFRTIRDRLAPGGLFCQWLPVYQLDMATLRVIVRTFIEVFPDAHGFLLRFNVDTPVLGLITGLQTNLYTPRYFAHRVRDPNLHKQLQAEQLRDAFHLFGCFVAGPGALRQLSQSARVNTDNMPVVLFEAPKFTRRESEPSYARLMLLLENGSSPTSLFPDDSLETERFVSELAAFIAARNAYLRGLAAEAEGDLSTAIDGYVESAKLSPRFSTGYSHGLSIAMREVRTDPALARRLLERLAAARPERPVATQLVNKLFP